MDTKAKSRLAKLNTKKITGTITKDEENELKALKDAEGKDQGMEEGVK
jgi:hypothetical protein